ncbi:MAG: YdbH domain-containing protein [Erythrobacter sp.]
MASAEAENLEQTPVRSFLPRRRRWRALLLVLSLIGLTAVWAWLVREDYASDFIDAELTKLELPAAYEIVSIGPQTQVLRNVVVGNADRPDLTIERVEVDLEYRFGVPSIGKVEVIKPRLFGTFQAGELSFGSLDPLLFGESEEEPGLPELNLKLVDARGQIAGDIGAIGFKAEGEGALNDGFSGILAVTAPGIEIQDCAVSQATLYGDLTTASGRPQFSGPVRLRGLDCASLEGGLQEADIAVQLAIDENLGGAGGELGLSASGLSFGSSAIPALNGNVQLTWREGVFVARHRLSGSELTSPYGRLAELSADGALRAGEGFDRIEWDSRIEAEQLALGRDISAQLDETGGALSGTLLEPLFAKFQRAIAGTGSGSSLAADLTLRQSSSSTSLVVPEARIHSASGETLVGLSRFSWSSSDDAPDRLRGNFVSQGAGMPQISGRMERQGDGELALRLQMQEYAAGESRLAIPELMVSQAANGNWRFAGGILADGAVPGGFVKGLRLPVSGAWSARDGLSLGQSCTDVRFDQASLSNVSLNRRSITICPNQGQALVEYGSSLRLAGNLNDFDLEGELSGSPFALQTQQVNLQYPGLMTAQNVDVQLGGDQQTARLTLANLEADLGDLISGKFDGGEVYLDAVPLDLVETSGQWTYEEGVLSLDQSKFRVLDREVEDRFAPLVARDAVLQLSENVITARARLRHPASDRVVSEVDIVHDLGSSSGNANIDVAQLAFDGALQPADLTVYADGVVALAIGYVNGSGWINWNETDITSGGSFSTEDFDFAAAFGPVENAKATIEFTDLLSLTTAPDQVLELGSINSGIEVFEGRITYSLTDGQFLSLKEARWPFMGGELLLRSVDLNLAAEEERRYIFEIIGLDAGTFIQEMEFGNLAAAGKFDGTLPIVFDSLGNGQIEEGLLISREPGGNLSYVGDLAYEDLGVMANFAFSALRSLNFNQMSITMNGRLTGEIITSIRFDGISQGEGTSSNFVTRQLAALPIRFNVNVRTQFLELSRLLRSTYDSTYLPDPCLNRDPAWRASRFFQTACRDEEEPLPEDIPLGELPIQPEESENAPL